MPALLEYDDLPLDTRRALKAIDEGLTRDPFERIAMLSRVVDAHPGFLGGQVRLGGLLLDEGRDEEAARRFQAAAAVAPDDPRALLGLAWRRLASGDLEGAAVLATRALPAAVTWHRGELLAVLAQAARSERRLDDAARLYLEAYEMCGDIACLEQHGRLAGFDPEDRWTIGTAQRRWLSAAVGDVLRTLGREKAPDGGEREVLRKGCDATLRSTSAWAAHAGVERGPLYAALARGYASCDCEVVMNGEDETPPSVLVAGQIEGSSDEVRDRLHGLVRGEPTGAQPVLNRSPEDDGDFIDLFIDGATIPLQLGDSMTLGAILRRLAAQPLSRASVDLLVGVIGDPVTLVTTSVEGVPLRFRALDGGPLDAPLLQRWPTVADVLVAMRAGIPV